MVLDVSYDTIIQAIGHDGSEVLWPDLPEPLCRRGFHIEEIQYAVLFAFNIPLAPFVKAFEYNPGARTDLQFAQYDLPLDKVMARYDGVAVGSWPRGNAHAVAWNAKERLYYDPEGFQTPDNFDIEFFFIAVGM